MTGDGAGVLNDNTEYGDDGAAVNGDDGDDNDADDDSDAGDDDYWKPPSLVSATTIATVSSAHFSHPCLISSQSMMIIITIIMVKMMIAFAENHPERLKDASTVADDDQSWPMTMSMMVTMKIDEKWLKSMSFLSFYIFPILSGWNVFFIF